MDKYMCVKNIRWEAKRLGNIQVSENKLVSWFITKDYSCTVIKSFDI